MYQFYEKANFGEFWNRRTGLVLGIGFCLLENPYDVDFENMAFEYGDRNVHTKPHKTTPLFFHMRRAAINFIIIKHVLQSCVCMHPNSPGLYAHENLTMSR